MTAINSIKVFSRATCAPCKTVKMILERRKLNYETIDVDEFPEDFQKLIGTSGTSIVPQILIHKTIDGKEQTDLIVGLNPTKLFGL